MVELSAKKIILATAKPGAAPARTLKLGSGPLDFAYVPQAQKPWCATLHRGGKFHKFEVATAKRAKTFKKLGTKSRTSAFCRKDASSIIAGGEDGSLGIYDAQTGKLLCKGPKSEYAIVSVDFWCGYVLAIDASNYLKVYGFDGKTLKCVWIVRLTNDPHVVKLTTLKENRLHLVGVMQESFRLEVMGQMYLDSTIFIPRCKPHGGCVFEGLALNPARTWYAAAVSHTACGEGEPFLTMTTGALHDTDTKKTYTVLGNFSNAKIACNWDISRVSVTDSLHRVHWLSLKGLDPLCFAAHKGPVKKMYVHTDSENEEIVTIADDGTVVMWTVPRD